MSGATLHVVRGNNHPSLPERLRREWMVIARQNDDETVAVIAFDSRQDAVSRAASEARTNKRYGGVHYTAGFYKLHDDGSWRAQ